MRRSGLRRLVLLLVSSALLMPLVAAARPAADSSLDPGARFFVPPPNPGALHQIEDLKAAGRSNDAVLISKLVSVPHAVWITQGSPADARSRVKEAIRRAGRQHAVPVLVAYNIPGRDCAGLSAGGAVTTAEYKAWIDGFASGIGGHEVVVILEPDSLGLLPSNCGEGFPFTDAQRYEELNYAVDQLAARPHASVYLDATHSRWLSVGDASLRLATAGAQRVRGFFLNVSNYRVTSDLERYGTWISKCIAFANNPDEGGWRLGHYDWCASQYFSPLGNVNPDDPSTWGAVDAWYDANLGAAVPVTHYVIDTSRNGQGPWTPTVSYPDPQDWCNPPGRGVGLRPTANLGGGLLDAYLWVKVPGESDGSCARGLGPPGSTVDPEWGVVDPAAGQWFPEAALELAQLANPPLDN